ncbi:MAG TPA: NAD(+) diphosphatase [Acidimicrobiales bacterium]|nr:NAD(+) diphosphatase [Acidimicrobiales bacterium]
MLQPTLIPTEPSAGPSLCIVVHGRDIDLTDGPADGSSPAEEALFVGTLDGRHCWAVEGGEGGTGPGAPAPVNLMQLHSQVDEATWLAAGRAVQLIEWDRNHRFCGRCGIPTRAEHRERARRCPSCDLTAFPRLAPAIITLVERDDGRVLLARNANWPTAMYSCLAGFVEPGESVEAAVGREVLEEVGVEVGALRYFGSQPWPFPHSLMLGFHARYVGGDIRVDGEEIAEARWFGRDDLPQIPGRISIARRLIDDWIAAG